MVVLLRNRSQVFFLKMGHPRPLFSIYFRLFKQTVQFLQCEKMCIQYTVLRFEPTTFGTRISFHKYWTRAPARTVLYVCVHQIFFSFSFYDLSSFSGDRTPRGTVEIFLIDRHYLCNKTCKISVTIF